MDIKHIRELIKLMKENDLTEIRINEGEEKLLLKRGTGDIVQISQSAGQYQPAISNATLANIQQTPQAPQQPQAQTQQADSAQKTTDESDKYLTIDSPMVGTFYAAPAPDAEPYVKVGDKVTPDTVVCIVEAMKVMNEIKAEVSGTIEKILVNNAEPVEFGQPLFQVKPD